jgi:hypothetical protein
MGGGRGGGNGPTSSSASAHNNLENLRLGFPSTNSGYFGKAGRSTTRRQISSSNPSESAADFFGKASKGASSITTTERGGQVARFRDGSFITYRATSSKDGSPVIDINVNNATNGWAKSQKIHFVRV